MLSTNDPWKIAFTTWESSKLGGNKNSFFYLVLQKATQHLKTSCHKSLRIRSILCPVVLGIYMGNVECCSQSHEGVGDIIRLRCHRSLLPRFRCLFVYLFFYLTKHSPDCCKLLICFWNSDKVFSQSFC